MRSICQCCGKHKERNGIKTCEACVECKFDGVQWRRAGDCHVLRRARRAMSFRHSKLDKLP
jgi:hypothetical protein